MGLKAIGVLVAIIITFACTVTVKDCIQENIDFDGLLWGLLVGVTTGILWCIIFYQQVGHELDLLILRQEKDKIQKATRKVVSVKRDIRSGLILGLIIGCVFWFMIGFVTA